MRVSLRRKRFASVASSALAVVKFPGQRFAERVAILLGVRIMTVHATHGTVAIAIAIEMVSLITKCPYAAIGGIGVLKVRQLQRKMSLKRCAGQIRIFAQNVLGGVTLKTNHERLVFGEGGQRSHADVGQFF